MFIYGQKSIALSALMLAGCLAILAGCAHNNAADPAAVPEPPSGLTATAGNAMVTLKWTASSGATGYNVMRATTSGGPYTQLAAPTSTGYADSSVANGTTYFYVVAALSAVGETADSTEASATPEAPGAAPTAPANLKAAAGNAQASLTWSASSGATSYHVKRATTTGGPYSQIGAPTSASYTDPSLTNGTTYYYVVSALDSTGESANSAQASATPAASAVIPATPTGLSAGAGNAQVALSWTASSGATGYHVKRATTSGGPYTQVGAPTSTSYTDTALTNGTTYYYVVSAIDSAGESADSAQASATPAAPAVIPATPTGLSAGPGNAQVVLSWTASSGATGYHVKRATTSGGPYTQVGAPTSNSYADTSLTNGTTYYYVVSATDSAGESANSVQVSALPAVPISTPGANACGMQLGTSAVIFCDTFDAPAGIGNRAGDLNGNVWGVSRASGEVNLGGLYNVWNPTLIQKCDGTTPTVIAPADVIICNGQVREATNDNNSGVFEEGNVTTLAMYPKQPFDFAGRTGTVSFDVSNDTNGSHAAWPEFWLTDLPVPVPFNHFATWLSLPANGLGIRFAANADPGSFGSCPNNNNINQLRWTVSTAVVVRGFVMDDTEGYGTRTALAVTDLDCATEASGPDQMNHVEIRISQNQIDVYATDAGVAATPATLKHIAVITNANLTLTRGLIWLEDVHYNADKGDPSRPSQRQHTFAWDNVAFDGPFTDRDFTFDALDNTAPAPNGSVNLAKLSPANQTSSWTVSNLPANPQAAAAKVLFNFDGGLGVPPASLNVIVNGHAHTVPWPYPDQLTNTWRTCAVAIPLSDLVAGTNVVQLGAATAQIFSNVDIVLADVSGGVPVLPGSNNSYPVN
jgi:fibronectin type 3 domain-containing protein